MAFENAYVSIQILGRDFRASATNPSAGKAVRAKDKFAAALLRVRRFSRQRCHIKIAVNIPIHGLEAEVS